MSWSGLHRPVAVLLSSTSGNTPTSKFFSFLGGNLSSVEAASAETKPRRRLPVWWWVGLVIILAVLGLTFVPGPMTTGFAGGESIHSPGLGDFFPEAIIWKGTQFEVNRLTLARFIAGGVICLIVAISALRLRRRPRGGQVLVEMLADFVRKNIGVEVLGNGRGRRYAVPLAVVFFGVLAMNLTGLIPGINIAASSVISVPLVFAVFSYLTFIVAGIRARGGWGFFREQLFPPGVPWLVYFLLTPIELLSTFVVRPVTLAIRLLSNMIAGHVLLAVTYFGTQTLLAAMSATSVLSVLTLAGSVVMTFFELFVAVLQAYVFTLLTAVYIKMSTEAH